MVDFLYRHCIENFRGYCREWGEGGREGRRGVSKKEGERERGRGGKGEKGREKEKGREGEGEGEGGKKSGESSSDQVPTFTDNSVSNRWAIYTTTRECNQYY